MARMLLLVTCLSLSSFAVGQDHPTPDPRPTPQPISPLAPAPTVREDSIPGLEDADFRLTPAPLRREGSFIIRQRASLARLPGGERVAVFHRDAAGRAERPMVLLPCLTLQTMEQLAADAGGDTAFLITGQVYAYRGVNYLLPTAAPLAQGAPPSEPAPNTPASPSADPSVDELIRALEANRDRPRTLGAAPKATGPADLIPEGSMISLKRGRLVRAASGDWTFTFDNNTTGESAADRALMVSPCLNLQRLETWASRLGDGASILLSGRVYQYQGRNHIIPTLFQVAAPGELSPRQ